MKNKDRGRRAGISNREAARLSGFDEKTVRKAIGHKEFDLADGKPLTTEAVDAWAMRKRGSGADQSADLGADLGADLRPQGPQVVRTRSAGGSHMTNKPQGISGREAARRMGVSESYVRKRAARGYLLKFPDGSIDPASVAQQIVERRGSPSRSADAFGNGAIWAAQNLVNQSGLIAATLAHACGVPICQCYALALAVTIGTMTEAENAMRAKGIEPFASNNDPAMWQPEEINWRQLAKESGEPFNVKAWKKFRTTLWSRS